jgi:small subunit ribosomal protein S17e
MKTLGKVRPENVKKVARELIRLHHDKFGIDFQANKQALGSLAQVSSARLRNRVAGYITRLLSIEQKAAAEEEGEAPAEEESEAAEGVEEKKE